jgi:DNA primase
MVWFTAAVIPWRLTMPQQYIDFAFVKENAQFEPVLAHYNLKPKGLKNSTQLSVLCPFHSERSPSCKIELERRIFHCFGCEAKGNILEFVARMEHSPDDLRAAALKLAGICKIPVAAPRNGGEKPPGVAVDVRKRPRTGKTRASPEVASAASGEPLKVNPPLSFALKLEPDHPYLDERGLSAELVAEFGLGYCSRGSMAGRICIPIHNEQGELVGYAGRWPGEDGIPEGEDRYKLPAKFQKSRLLFNLNRVVAGEHIVLVEGYWSAIRLHALGVPVAGLMGSSISVEQIALLRDRGIRFVTLLLDGDDPGRQARERGLPSLSSLFFVRSPELEYGQKPDVIVEAELLQLVSFPSA